VVDNGVAVVNEECTGHSKVTGLDVGKRVVEEFFRVGCPWKGGDLEDQGCLA
jgi:hypothetical protein